MIQLTETKDGWKVSLDGEQFQATEEQLLRLKDVINRRFTPTERLRRCCQHSWVDRTFKTERNRYGEDFVKVPDGRGNFARVDVEGFIRALHARDQEPARDLFRTLGCDTK